MFCLLLIGSFFSDSDKFWNLLQSLGLCPIEKMCQVKDIQAMVMVKFVMKPKISPNHIPIEVAQCSCDLTFFDCIGFFNDKSE